MKFKGRAWKFGENVNTDEIIAARYLNTSDPAELAKHCLEDIRSDFIAKANKSDIIVAGSNFGCGSSREHAPIALKGVISAVIAPSFARIFYRNAINIGLPIFESPEAAERIEEGDEVEIDATTGEIVNITKNEVYKSAPFPEFMQELIAVGGLMNYVQRKMKER